jgi:hypothetical protein
MNHGQFPFTRGAAPDARPRGRDWAEAPRASACESRQLTVIRGPRREAVDLGRLYSTACNDEPVVSLLDVWVAAGLGSDLFAVSFDLLDANRRPTARIGELRLESTLFAAGWLTLRTQEVIWAGPRTPAEHWHVRGITAIVAVKAGSRRRAALGAYRGI